MTTTFPQTNLNISSITWAILCSILLHISLAITIPNIHLHAVKKPLILEIELMNAPKPAPISIPQPIPPKPEPVKPAPVKTAKPAKLKPAPRPIVIKNEPADLSPLPSSKTEVIAVNPKVETLAEVKVPPVASLPIVPTPIMPTPPVKPPPAGPSQADIRVANGDYGNTLWNSISKYKNYPKIAQMRGWQGESIVELQLSGDGKISSKKIIKSSGYDVLDKKALEMVDKATPFPEPPEALRGSRFSITIPIPFKLE